MKPGTLAVVATPIGNLDDLSPRAAQILVAAGLIAAEDTRHSQPLLARIGARARLISLNDHNETERVDAILAVLAAGTDVALISDAGTPLISDPGYRLVRAVGDAGFRVMPVPGPSAPIAALSAAGLATDRFVFEGFLPARRGERLRRLAALKSETRTLILFESPHRVTETIVDMEQVFGGPRELCIARELTKQFETIARKPLAQWVEADQGPLARGEFVLIVDGAPKVSEGAELEIDLEQWLTALAPLVAPSELASVLARLSGLPRRELYQRLTAIREASR